MALALLLWVAEETALVSIRGSSHPMDLPNAPKAGDVIAGRYQVERTLGSGGMGVVVAAVDRKVGRTVAVKLLLQHLAGSVRVDRFFREARAVSSIRSDHVARVIEFGSLDNLQPYMVMECLTGRDLGERRVRRRG